MRESEIAGRPGGKAAWKQGAAKLLARATAPQGDRRIMPRVLLVFAHPDDEVVALGARLGRFRESYFAHVTDGAPRNEQDSRAHGFDRLDDYRQARAEELKRALDSAGVPENKSESIGLPDQEASMQLTRLTQEVARLLGRLAPDVIFTHPYEGGHPDHDACAFAVYHAAALERKKDGYAPVIAEGTFYHGGPQGIVAGKFLPAAEGTAETTYRLTHEEQQRKRALLDCFATQRETLRGIPLEYERFRVAPEYDFSKPPHGGPVYYDMHPWGMTSQHFCELARKAKEELEAHGWR